MSNPDDVSRNKSAAVKDIRQVRFSVRPSSIKMRDRHWASVVEVLHGLLASSKGAATHAQQAWLTGTRINTNLVCKSNRIQMRFTVLSSAISLLVVAAIG
jgi:hypothetical protein